MYDILEHKLAFPWRGSLITPRREISAPGMYRFPYTLHPTTSRLTVNMHTATIVTAQGTTKIVLYAHCHYRDSSRDDQNCFIL